MPPSQRLVNSSGVCVACEKPATETCIKCFACEDSWHALGCTKGNEDLVTKTFLEKQWNIWKTSGAYKSICFVCPPCRDARNLQRDIVNSNRISVIQENVSTVQENVSTVQNDVRELKEAFLKFNSDFPALPQASNDSNPGQVQSSDAVIVINNEEQQPVDRKTISAASYSSKAAVSTTYQNKQGNTVLICESEEAKNRLAADLKDRVKDRPIITPAQRLPTIRITGMEEEFSKAKIFDEIKVRNQNKGITIDENNFKVLFTRPHAKDPKLFQAIVRVSNEVRAAIKRAGDKLYVDLTLCHVWDHFHIRRCNQCQGYNHFKDTCTKTPCCGNCAGNHQTEDCQSDQVKCTNCVANKYENTDHQTSDPKCKSYMNAQKKLEQSIGFYKTKN